MTGLNNLRCCALHYRYLRSVFRAAANINKLGVTIITVITTKPRPIAAKHIHKCAAGLAANVVRDKLPIEANAAYCACAVSAVALAR